MKDGKLAFTRVPHTRADEATAQILRRADGSLWLPVWIGVGRGGEDYYVGQITCRVSY